MAMEAAETLANEVTKGTAGDIIILALAIGLINYFTLKKIVKSSRPFLISFLIVLTSIVICLPFFLSSRRSYLDFERGIDLTQYMDLPISNVRLCNYKDTIIVDNINVFISELQKAKMKRGPWKYPKTVRMIFKNNEGTSDTIFTNGYVFGPYKKNWFVADTNIIEQYLSTQLP
jgi:hypothetical protein